MASKEWDYAELMAVLGKYITAKGLNDVCLLEFEDGFIVTGIHVYEAHDGTRSSLETFVLSTQDLSKMLPGKRGLFRK